MVKNKIIFFFYFSFLCAARSVIKSNKGSKETAYHWTILFLGIYSVIPIIFFIFEFELYFNGIYYLLIFFYVILALTESKIFYRKRKLITTVRRVNLQLCKRYSWLVLLISIFFPIIIMALYGLFS